MVFCLLFESFNAQSFNEFQRESQRGRSTYFNKVQWFPTSFNEFQRVSTSFNEFQRVSTSLNEFQRVSTSFNESQRGSASFSNDFQREWPQWRFNCENLYMKGFRGAAAPSLLPRTYRHPLLPYLTCCYQMLDVICLPTCVNIQRRTYIRIYLFVIVQVNARLCRDWRYIII